MRRINRVIIYVLALIFIFNTGVFAADYDSSYSAGYEFGLDASYDYESGEYEVEDAFSDFRRSSKYNEVRESLGAKFDADEFREGFYKGFDEGISGAGKSDYASQLGKALGTIMGARDYQNGDKPDWEDAIPSDREIRRMYNLNVHDSNYRESFIDAFQLAFMDAYFISYEKTQYDPAKVTLSEGVRDGEEMGELLGSAFGYKDYYEGEDIDYTRNLPTERQITAEYSLNNDSKDYKSGFLSGFTRAYEKAYNEAYREANINDSIRDEGDALRSGQDIGRRLGEMQANNDYMQKFNNDWRRSIPDDRYIISEYGLELHTANYRELFISGFYDGYSEGYNNKYKELAQGAGVDKTISEIIPISGASVTTPDNAFNVTILPGTYYHQVNLGVNKSYDVGNKSFTTLVKASDSYKVSLLNTSGNLDDDKLVALSFEYYGHKIKGGIYKLVSGYWEYLPTTIENNIMTTYIKPSSLSSTGNIYSAFMDDNVMVLADARGHWAKDEINTYVRRGIIYGYSNMTFKPEQNISRAEFLTLLSRIYKWNTTIFTGQNLGFVDSNLFGSRAGIITYSYANGYIKGYSDGTFKPNNPISYSEIEIIMGRVLNNPYFRWKDTANNMLYNKKIRSNSFDNMNNKITRAEVVYMLYSVTESTY